MAAAFARVWRTPRVPSLLTGKLLSSLPSATFRAVFPLIALRAYGMDVQAQGLVMSVMGASAAFSQAVVVGWSEVRSCRQARGCAPSHAPPGVCARRFAAPMRGLTRLCRRQCHQRLQWCNSVKSNGIGAYYHSSNMLFSRNIQDNTLTSTKRCLYLSEAILNITQRLRHATCRYFVHLLRGLRLRCIHTGMAKQIDFKQLL